MHMNYVKFSVSENSNLYSDSLPGGLDRSYHKGVILNCFLLIRICLCKRIWCSGAVRLLFIA